MIFPDKSYHKQREDNLAWGHWFAFVNVILSICIASIYAVSVPLPDSFIGNTYMLVNWIGHISFISFVFFILFVLPVCYLIKSIRFIKLWGAVATATGIALLALDALFFTKTGSHINDMSSVSLGQQASFALDQVASQYRGYLAVLFAVWLSLQLAIANGIWKRLERLRRPPVAKVGAGIFVCCFIISHLMHMWADTKLYKPILQQDDMFPLSYPLTAKTLMANYGLFDLSRHQQQQVIQFNNNIDTINYPLRPVYCAIDDKPVLLLVSTEGGIDTLDAVDTLSRWQQHYDLTTNPSSSAFNLIYSMPDIYTDIMQGKLPIIIDLPSQLGMPVSLYQSTRLLKFSPLKPYIQPWDGFTQAIQNKQGVSVGFVSNTQLNQVLSSIQNNDYRLLITELGNGGQASLYSNIEMKNSIAMSQHLDVVPTLLSQAGCRAPSDAYSTGHNALQTPQEWLINTTVDGIVIQTMTEHTRIYNTGHHDTHDNQGNRLNQHPLPMHLLKPGIKKITQFIQ